MAGTTIAASPDPSDLQWLQDRFALCELRARYCRHLDFKQWDDLRSLFTDDAELRLAGGTHYPSADDFVDTMRRNFAGDEQVVHHCQMPELVRLGPDRARGVWALFSLLDRQQSPAMQSYSYYAEEYRRVAGTWKIAFLAMVRLRSDPLGSGDARLVTSDWLEGGVVLTRFLADRDANSSPARAFAGQKDV